MTKDFPADPDGTLKIFLRQWTASAYASFTAVVKSEPGMLSQRKFGLEDVVYSGRDG